MLVCALRAPVFFGGCIFMRGKVGRRLSRFLVRAVVMCGEFTSLVGFWGPRWVMSDWGLAQMVYG